MSNPAAVTPVARIWVPITAIRRIRVGRGSERAALVLTAVTGWWTGGHWIAGERMRDGAMRFIIRHNPR